MPAKITIPTGARFGRLEVLGESPQRKASGFVAWGCRCDCGMIVIVAGAYLRSGHTLSCGCLTRERTVEGHVTHGMTDTPEYASWSAMRARCLNPANRQYRNYGARGITICPAWADFAAFYRDMGPRPTPKHTIDRIDNDGPYSPENCRWASPLQQSRNRRFARLLTHDGQTRRLSEWGEMHGLPPGVIHKRLGRRWTMEQALTIPLGGRVSVRVGKRWLLPSN